LCRSNANVKTKKVLKIPRFFYSSWAFCTICAQKQRFVNAYFLR
jgi:hypothetical protein